MGAAPACRRGYLREQGPARTCNSPGSPTGSPGCGPQPGPWPLCCWHCCSHPPWGALGVRPGLVARITAKGLECGKARWPSLGRLTRSAPGCSGHGRGTQARFLGPGWDSGPRRPTSVSLRHLLVLAGFPPADETGLGCKCLVWEMIPGHTLGERKCEAGKEGRHTLRSAPVRYLVHVIPPF